MPSLLAGKAGGIIGKGLLSFAGSKLGGKPKTQSTNQTQLPPWMEKSSQDAVARGQELGTRAFTQYTDPRVAGLTGNEQLASQTASGAAGGGMPYLQNAQAALTRGTQTFPEADINAYMNPFIKQALDPAARDIGEQFSMRGNQDNAMAASRGAFGGSRHSMMDANRMNAEGRALGDLYGQGYGRAFDTAAGQWNQDMNRQMQGSGQWAGLGQMHDSLVGNDINRLMSTGGMERGVQQAGLDTDFQEFMRGQNWDYQTMNTWLDSLRASPYGQTQTQTNTGSTSPLGTGIGIFGKLGGVDDLKGFFNPAAKAAPKVPGKV